MRMDEVIKGHLAVMDKYDPDHKISLIVDEWGTWYDVEPGTNPGFLYQQNTMRDAIVAAEPLLRKLRPIQEHGGQRRTVQDSRQELVNSIYYTIN